MSTQNESKHPQAPSKLKHYLTAAIVILLLWGSSIQTEATARELIEGFPNMFDLLKEMFPPKWTYFDNIVGAMLDTIRMALLGTTFGAILAIPTALLCASNLTTSRWLHYPVRFVLNLIRTIPDLLLAAIFVTIVGLGPLPGIMALAVFSWGLIAKLTFEALDRGRGRRDHLRGPFARIGQDRGHGLCPHPPRCAGRHPGAGCQSGSPRHRGSTARATFPGPQPLPSPPVRPSPRRRSGNPGCPAKYARRKSDSGPLSRPRRPRRRRTVPPSRTSTSRASERTPANTRVAPSHSIARLARATPPRSAKAPSADSLLPRRATFPPVYSLRIPPKPACARVASHVSWYPLSRTCPRVLPSPFQCRVRNCRWSFAFAPMPCSRMALTLSGRNPAWL